MYMYSAGKKRKYPPLFLFQMIVQKIYRCQSIQNYVYCYKVGLNLPVRADYTFKFERPLKFTMSIHNFEKSIFILHSIYAQIRNL